MEENPYPGMLWSTRDQGREMSILERDETEMKREAPHTLMSLIKGRK